MSVWSHIGKMRLGQGVGGDLRLPRDHGSQPGFLALRMHRRNASEWREVTAIAVPVVIVQVGMMFMGVVDSVFVGHVSATALAAAAVGNIYFWNAIVVAMGALMVLDPLVSQALGAGDEASITRNV